MNKELLDYLQELMDDDTFKNLTKAGKFEAIKTAIDTYEENEEYILAHRSWKWISSLIGFEDRETAYLCGYSAGYKRGIKN